MSCFSQDGHTAIHLASISRNDEVLKLLLASGSDPKMQDKVYVNRTVGNPTYTYLHFSICVTKIVPCQIHRYIFVHIQNGTTYP